MAEVAQRSRRTREPARTRRVAFRTAVGLALASMLITGPLLTLPVTAWFPESVLDAMFGEQGLGAHRAHMAGAATLFWLTIVALVAQFRHPERHPAPLWAVAGGWLVFLPLELTHLVDPYTIVVVVLMVAVLVLHPRRWTPVRFDQRTRVVALPAVAASVVYGSQQALDQFRALPDDPHAAGSHYALMAALAIAFAISALAGASDAPGRTVAAWSAGLAAANVGVFSIAHPEQASSLGVGWGIAAVAWAVIWSWTIVTRPLAPRRADATPGVTR